MRTEIRVGGLGGQGVILCGMIIGKAAAIFNGKHATLIQAFGPEARGSAASAQVTLSDEPIGYPYVRRPDVLVVMSPDAYTTFLPTLKEGGTLLYESDLVQPDHQVPAGVKKWGVPATRLAEELGRRLVMNIVMVGFFAATTQLVSYEAAKKAVLDSVPKGTEELNLRAFEAGYNFGRELLAGEGHRVA
ncbi:MAG: 2-oxoacid:acceptor oxidoreductase family protein [Thermoanaerobaculum sp.]|nr:2-oxoacid:acceptor oxidoreductase family protein [Thermoanaerobaculum sp.]